MVAYLDSSVLLRYILLGDPSIREALSCDRVISSELLEIESRRVLHRYRLEGDLDDEAYLTALERMEEVITGLSLLELSRSVKKRAMGAFPVTVKTLDTLHIASMVVFAEAKPEETVILYSHDAAMNRCSKALSFSAPFA